MVVGSISVFPDYQVALIIRESGRPQPDQVKVAGSIPGEHGQIRYVFEQDNYNIVTR